MGIQQIQRYLGPRPFLDPVNLRISERIQKGVSHVMEQLIFFMVILDGHHDFSNNFSRQYFLFNYCSNKYYNFRLFEVQELQNNLDCITLFSIIFFFALFLTFKGRFRLV